MQTWAVVVLVIILFVLGVYFMKTGANLTLNNATSSRGGFTAPNLQGNFNLPQGRTSAGGNITGAETLPGQVSTTPEEGAALQIPENSEFEITHLSPNYKRVQFGTFDPQNQISLKAAFSEAGGIDITGWEIRGRNGGTFVPRAVAIYDPTGTAEPADIILRSGEVLNLYTQGSSALGVNFRPNKCMGYLANSIDFSPSISRDCPGGDTTAVQNYSAECQDYVNSLGGCKEPNPNPPNVPYWDTACRDYLKQFNYAGCFKNYLGASDFLSNEWRAWVGPVGINAKHDRVFLLDREGLIVDIKSY